MTCAIQKVYVDCEGVVQDGRTSVGTFASAETRRPALPRCSVLLQFEQFHLYNLSHEVPRYVPEYECPKCQGFVSKSDGKDFADGHM